MPLMPPEVQQHPATPLQYADVRGPIWTVPEPKEQSYSSHSSAIHSPIAKLLSAGSERLRKFPEGFTKPRKILNFVKPNQTIMKIDDRAALVLEGGGLRGVFTCGVNITEEMLEKYR